MYSKYFVYCFIIIFIIFVLLIINNNNNNNNNNNISSFGFQRYNNKKHNVYGDIFTFDDTDHISKYISNNNDIWEEHICQILAQNYVKNTDVLDIGANMGLNSIRMNQINPISSGYKIHFFEPQHDVFSILDYNTRDIPRVLYNFALSDKYKLLNFSKIEDNIGATEMVLTKDNNNINILATNLDSITFERPISLVKLDAEGSEEDVLKGGKLFFEKYKPTLVIEIWDKNKELVMPILSKMNYKQTWNQDDDYVFKYNNSYKSSKNRA